MRSIVLFSFLSLVFITNSNSSSEDPSYIKVTAHNIGQGNCITAKLFDADQEEPIYILMDGGSSAFRKELYCQKYFLEKRQSIEQAKTLTEVEKEEYELNSPPRSSTSSTIPQSALRAPTPRESKALRTAPHSSNKDIKNEMIKEIRTALGMIKLDTPIKVTTFFISHPDSDHYNFFEDIFDHRKDIIQNIILGGLPAKYSSQFRDWLQYRIKYKKAKVYFPALALDQPISSIKTILRHCKDIEGLMYSPLYAPQMFSSPEEGWIPVEHLKDFEKALPFSKNIKTYLLSVNPTHWKEEGKEVVARACLEDDDNSDSLVIKLQVGVHSIIITGDATNMTSGRILGNYSDNLGFLKSTIITSDHHGSKTHGSNNLPWIRATAPQHVIFSCGIMHGHPSLPAYNNAKQSPNLARTEPHDIWVWETPEKKKDKEDEETYTKGRKVSVHTTHQSLFSTFSSGTLTFTLPEAGEISVESQILDFGTKKLGPKKQYTASPAKEELESQSEEEALDIPFEEDELEEFEKSFLEETESALTPEKPIEPQKLLSLPQSPYESGTSKGKKRKHGKAEEEEGESSVTPLLQVGKKGPLQKKGRSAIPITLLKSTSGELKKPKKVLLKSLFDEKKTKSPSKEELKGSDLGEEKFADLGQSSSTLSTRKAGKSEKLSPSTSESSSDFKKKQGVKRKQREIVPEEEKTVAKEKGSKKQRGDSLAIKDKPAKGSSSIAKKKEKPKKEQKQPTEKLEKKKGPQATTSKGKKGGGKKNK
jgi:hypothetical protein